MNERNKSRIKELFFRHPEISAKKAAKMLGLSMFDTLKEMQKLGYTKYQHEKARLAVMRGEKPEPPKKKVAPEQTAKKPSQPKAKPQVVKKNVVSVPCGFSHLPSPETMEHRREAQLFKQANALLQKAKKSALNGEIEKYLQYRKEYEIAARQAEAYKKRGTLNKSEREISAIENQYRICK